MKCIDPTQVASSTPYDDTLTNLGDTVQEALDNIGSLSTPGYTWGKSGNLDAPQWLRNDTVPSNKSGRRVFLIDAIVTDLYITSRNADTFTVKLFEHTGPGTQVLVDTFNVVSSRTADFTGLTTSVTTGKELAVKITSGEATDLQVGLLLQGKKA